MGGIDHQKVWAGSRVILHIDMDAFFAAVEQSINPGLKGRPVIVGGTPESRGVVSTCSYEARNYGVHSAMPMKQAQRLCPEAVFIDTSGGKYSYLSTRILNILRQYSPYVEPVSIDEAFADITGIWKRYRSPQLTAESIKRDIFERHGLTSSIGIAPNRLVAKMASSSNKPDGLVIIPPEEVRQYLWVQPVGHLWGVGPKSVKELNKIGIITIGDLATASEKRLKDMFGIMGPGLIKMANGQGADQVRASHIEYEARSIGHEHTFDKNTNDPDRVLGLLLYLSDRVSRRLRQSGCEARTVTLKVRKPDFKLVTRAVTALGYFDTEKVIYTSAKNLLNKNRVLEQPVRLLGVSVSHLRKRAIPHYDDLLSEYGDQNRSRRIDELLDSLRNRHGEESIFIAGSRIF